VTCGPGRWHRIGGKAATSVEAMLELMVAIFRDPLPVGVSSRGADQVTVVAGLAATPIRSNASVHPSPTSCGVIEVGLL
jgi:hypothetical protein